MPKGASTTRLGYFSPIIREKPPVPPADGQGKKEHFLWHTYFCFNDPVLSILKMKL